jgi:hypothetical protein
MTSSSLEVTPATTTGAPLRRHGSGWAVDLVLDAFIVVLAAWTLTYQIGLVAPVDIVVLFVLAVPLAGLFWWARLRLRGHRSEAEPAAVEDALPARPAMHAGVSRGTRLYLVSATVVGAAAVVLAWHGHRPLAAGLLLVGTAVALLLLRRCPDLLGSTAQWLGSWRSRPYGWVTGAWAVAMAVLSTQLAREDGDDPYFVTLSTYMAQHGRVPLKDVIYSDQVFPTLTSHSPPIHSWEGAIGVVARLSGMSAPFVAYGIALPLMSALAVLALSRLVRMSAVATPSIALSAALAFWLLDGSGGFSWSYLFIMRLWSGKIVLVAVVLPLMIAYAIRWLGSGRRDHALMLFLAGLCAIGASNSSSFLVPLCCVAFCVAGLVHGVWRRALVCLLPVVPAVAAGAVAFVSDHSRAVHSVSAPPNNGPVAGAPVPLTLLEQFAGNGGHLLLVALALAIGWAGLRTRVARLTVVSMVLVFAVTLQAPVQSVLSSFGLRPVYWRMWFLVPMPLLVAGLVGGAAWLAGAGHEGSRACRRRPRLRLVVQSQLAAVAAALLVLVAIIPGGTPASSLTNDAFLVHWGQMKSYPLNVDQARHLLTHAHQGDVVLAPIRMSRSARMLDTRVLMLVPRGNYVGTQYLGQPGFHADARLRLQNWAGRRQSLSTEQLGKDLKRLRVAMVCMVPAAIPQLNQARAVGYVDAVVADGVVTCLRRAGT